MCGVGGIYIPDPQVMSDRHLGMLERMGKAMERRGPDAQGIVSNERAGLVHRRLSIIDLDPRSNQPMESADWVLSYNGEIYNFKSIRSELDSKYSFETTSDTEVLLLAIQEWGIEGALSRCAGMYAFLAYNKQTGLMYAARDRLGIKPLLMARLTEGEYCFASSVTAITKASPDQEWSPFKPALGSFFALGAPFTRSSVLEGIERIEPAHYVTCFPNGDFTTTRYWEPTYQPNFTMDDMLSVVAEYQVADVPSALFLSGGVDSTFLAAATEELDCFHLVSPEMNYAKAVADRFGRRFVAVEPNLDEYQEDIENVIRFHGEPLMSCGIPASVSREVRSNGYTMAISANGADELFHGYPRTPMPEYDPDYLPLHEEASRKYLFDQITHIFRDSRNFVIDGLEEHVPSIEILTYDILKKYHLPNFPRSASHRWMELMTYVLHDLNPTLDAASMYNSIEVRVPFLDHRIVEGVLSWDASMLVTPTLGRKAPLKQHLHQYLPMSFFHRPKLGFSIHGESLASIVKMANRALSTAKREGLIKFVRGARYGEYDRDMVTLEAICLTYMAWERMAREPVVS
ncbi:MAG: asparagine synthase (glutamine-hydrolyzing) [Phycisphaerae bacterium]|nr:asparagine synthase (glutamine-hydrolyzing) [Phycisphaerae bacterium]